MWSHNKREYSDISFSWNKNTQKNLTQTSNTDKYLVEIKEMYYKVKAWIFINNLSG